MPLTHAIWLHNLRGQYCSHLTRHLRKIILYDGRITEPALPSPVVSKVLHRASHERLFQNYRLYICAKGERIYASVFSSKPGCLLIV